jgi:hypothetical protein
MDSAVAEAGILRGELAHHFEHGCVALVQRGLVPDRRSRDVKQRARTAKRDPAPTHVRDLLPPSGRALHFFRATSLITSISRSRSATSFLSFAFSCSS